MWLTPFVGREAEMTQLMTLCKKSVRGERFVVLIQGVLGAGKSRWVYALKKQLANGYGN
ncbi:MAG: ATP-binding protein [Gallionella sp.]